MARIRTIKPTFFTSDTVSTLPLRARLTWIGIWTHCDDQGRCRDNVKLIKAAVWPLDDVSLRDIAEDITVLVASKVLLRYEVAGKTYLQVAGWDEHQRVNRPTKSEIPSPDDGRILPPDPPPGGLSDDSLRTHAQLAEGSLPERKGREGNKEEEAPSALRASARDRAAALSATAHSPEARAIVDEFGKRITRRPPASVRRDLAVHVDELLAEDWPLELIHRALDAWSAKGLHQKTFPSVANEVANRNPAAAARAAPDRPSTTDQRVAAAQALKGQLAANATQGATVLQLPTGDTR